MVAVSKPQYELRWENALTYQLSKRGHFLLSGWIIKGASLELFREIAPSATTNQQFIKGKLLAFIARNHVNRVRCYHYHAEDFLRQNTTGLDIWQCNQRHNQGKVLGLVEFDYAFNATSFAKASAY